MQITVHNLQRVCSTCCSPVDDPVLLPSNAWLTDRIRSSVGVDVDAKDNIGVEKMFDLTDTEVSKAMVPEIQSKRQK